MVFAALAFPGSTEAASFNEVKKLIASDAQQDDQFGESVAISGDTTVVGADGEDAGGISSGAAYVFERNEGAASNWGEVKKLTASDAQAGDNFGLSVAISSDTVVVGSPREDVGGSQFDDFGAAYIFQRNEGGADNWGQVAKLTASDALLDDQFGWSVAISGDIAVIGIYREVAGGNDAGAAYVFRRDEGGTDNWGEVKRLTAFGAKLGDEFGISVAVSGDTAVVGASRDDAGGSDAGAAYVFQRNEGGADTWGEVKKLTASDGQAFDQFGGSVAISGDTAVVGATGKDAKGVLA
ncbi:MAG: FG-GAP repeat protein, partial [Chloroflexi bacterium]|nr:FG-GAP repeat protein [Chloroflexota bacterium]